MVLKKIINQFYVHSWNCFDGLLHPLFIFVLRSRQVSVWCCTGKQSFYDTVQAKRYIVIYLLLMYIMLFIHIVLLLQLLRCLSTQTARDKRDYHIGFLQFHENSRFY